MLPIEPISLVLSLAQFAPSIMKYFGVGEKSTEVAQKVIDIAQQVTGTSSGPEALAALQADKQRAHDFALAIMANDTDLERAFLADRQDARSRDVAFLNAGKVNHRANAMLLLAFIAVIAIASLLALGSVDGADAVGGFLITIGGMFARNIGTAFDFEFGSSRGSKEKDGLLGQLSKSSKNQTKN